MFDYVVVGAGSAGCVLASRLSADPGATVLLLEAGPPDRKLEIRVPAAAARLFKTAYDWDYTTAPQPGLAGRELYWPRGKTLGGSSAINFQMYARGHRADFDHWAELGNPGWSFEQVLPYFQRLERFGRGDRRLRGRNGPLCIEDLGDPNPMTRAFVRAAVEAGLPANDDVNGAVQDGVGLSQVTQRRGRRWSAADAYLRPARRRRNLTVRTGARATRVLFERGRAAGVEYLDLAGRRRKVATARAAREVILAAGAVASPHLLLCSGAGPAEMLRGAGVRVVHDLPGVGGNLQDHLAVWVVAASPRPVSLTAAESPANLARWLLLRRGMLTSNGGEACAFTRTDPTLPAPDLELVFAPGPYIDHLLQRPAWHGLAVGAAALQPRSRGRVTLASADPLAPPRIHPRYLSDPEGRDLATLACGVTLARRILQMPALAAFAGETVEPPPGVRSDAEVETFIREQAETIYHPVGTCRMGQDALAVVDPGLRVHGLDGLRVADASVMPAIVRGHTNAATIMIAEKAASSGARSPPPRPRPPPRDGLRTALPPGPWKMKRRTNMQTATSYLDRVLPAIDVVTGRFAALVTAAPDPAARVPTSPGWTVRDVAAHLATVAVRYADGPEGRGAWTETPLDLPALNHDQIEALGAATVGDLVASLRRDLAALQAQIRGYGSSPPSFRFHGGERVPADIALGILLGELLVHSWDIARALRRPWPIDPGHAALVVEGLNPILPGWVRPERVRGLTAGFEIRLRGQASHVWAFRDGRLHVNPAERGRIDVRISADPAAFVLVCYRREPQWKHIATGRMLAWGRRPWLAPTLVSRFHNP